ncbi:sushi, von Willebrand factor type A, EGF and pentraxin domain-containing protein 1-like isoform X4 [Mercenaria mercenaria]|uniref:sushi, von Willebrand factor type A, EGF and pentraxin domain-containing protein 1-like isoform X4 n=1 Tax=Mercenaria mercenaria TaxID=6596 RepID=UPI00234F759F|nr:sushi, von Willebrand factor type A, EGF and pentraxin domain-containing protein 1-like isoform X4 [Mercenaria mercenaria]
MGESYFVLGFGFCLLIQLNTGQLLPEEELRNETSCTLDVNISCSNNEIIAVHSLYFFYDSDCTNTCCTYNSSHSSIGADENDIQEIRRLCSGRESCSPALDGKRNFGLLNVQTPSYVMVQYFCIPVLVDCEDKYNISNGYISSRDVNNTGKGSLADVSCDAGYETNKTYVSCLETGHWENATCSPKDCGNLPEIRNGEYTLKDPQNTTYGALATVNCSKGFEAKSSSISCLESGQWSRVSCTSKGQLLPEEELRNETSCTLDVNISCSNNEIIAVHSLYFFYDSDCTNRCCTYNSSHSSIGGDENDIQEIRRLCSGRESCSHALDGKRDFGSLNVQTPSYVMVQYFCIPDCEDKYNISNGYLSPRDVNNTGKGSLADVSCDAGYETNKTYVSCLETGHWENATCSPKDCGNLPEIRNGEYTLKDPQNTTYAALATVNCSKGFEAKSSSISCLESGQWSRVSCTSKDCGNPPVIDYGSIRSEDGSTTYTSTARVTCQEGYKAKKQVITCKETGMWESSSCEPKDCGNPPVIDYGSITLEDESATYKSTARVKCQEGYKAKKLVVTCKETGMWESSSCEPTENTHDEKQQAEDGNASSTTLVAVLVSLMVIVILILAVYVIWRYRHRLCKTRSFKGHESISFKNEEVLPEDQGYQNLNISFVNEGGESKDQQCQDPNVSFKNEDIRPEISEVQPSQDSNTNIQTDEIVPEKQQCQESTVAVKTDENLPEIQLQESNVAVKTDDVLTEKDTNVDAMTAKVLHENEQGPDSNETAPNDELPENQQSQESNIAVKTDEVLTEKDKNVDAMTEKVLHENEQGQDSNVTAPNDELPENQQSQVSNVAGDSEEKEKPDQH